MRTSEKILIGALLALTLGLGLYTALGPISGKQAKLKADLEQLKSENNRLAEENRRLTLEVKALRSRQDYQEKVIRQELGLIKPGEVLVQLPSKKGKPVSMKTKASLDGGH